MVATMAPVALGVCGAAHIGERQIGVGIGWPGAGSGRGGGWIGGGGSELGSGRGTGCCCRTSCPPTEMRAAPRARRSGAAAEALHDIAPPHALVASILDERGLGAVDLHGAFRETTARQAVLLDTQLGRDAMILQLRAALDGHMAQAVLVCRQYQDAADAMIRLEVRVETMRRTAPWRLGPLKGEVARARAKFRDRALTARGAADAALGFADALALYIRSRSAFAQLDPGSGRVSLFRQTGISL